MEDFTFQLIFYGTRGSIPVCEPGFQEFGGNTTCLALRGPDAKIFGVLDAGSGIRILGREIMSGMYPKPEQIFIGFSHFHWDHIQGLPFFNPAYVPGFEIHIIAMGFERDALKLKRIFEVQMQQEYFPVQLNQMAAEFIYEVPELETTTMGDTHVIARRHNHPGGAYSRRFERNGKSIVVATDIEHGDTLDEGIIDLAKGADLLVHEAQYTQKEYEEHRGWGHSSYDQAIEVAKAAGVKQLIMTHHDPDHDDEFLLEQERRCKQLFPNSSLAREGMVVTL